MAKLDNFGPFSLSKQDPGYSGEDAIYTTVLPDELPLDRDPEAKEDTCIEGVVFLLWEVDSQIIVHSYDEDGNDYEVESVNVATWNQREVLAAAVGLAAKFGYTDLDQFANAVKASFKPEGK